jgi:hypothetical protein
MIGAADGCHPYVEVVSYFKKMGFESSQMASGRDVRILNCVPDSYNWVPCKQDAFAVTIPYMMLDDTLEKCQWRLLVAPRTNQLDYRPIQHLLNGGKIVKSTDSGDCRLNASEISNEQLREIYE